MHLCIVIMSGKNYFTVLLIMLFAFCVKAQEKPPFVDFINKEHHWVDSVFRKLSRNEKIAQLFLIRAHTNLGDGYVDSVAKIIRRQKLGGAVLFQGGPVRHAYMINKYQALSKVPLFLALDGEWGLGMRLPDSTISYPYQMALGAVQNDSLLYQMGQEVAKDFKRLGLNINFAPDVDINNNPNNPVINFRSFGENKDNVIRKGRQYMLGMQDEGIITTLKHFPGHGDTDVDSHHDLPQLPFDRARLDSLEIEPFRTLVRGGAGGVMVAHMNIPALDSTAHLPSSLSQPIISNMLREQLGFKGLVFTDAMDMKGVTKYFKDGEADVRAIIAGNDVLEVSENSRTAIRRIRRAIRQKRLSWDEIDRRVKKVLAAKYWLDGHQLSPVRIENLHQDLNRREALRLRDQLAEASITLLKGDSLLQTLDFTKATAIVSIGVDSLTTFQNALSATYEQGTPFVLSGDATAEEVEKVANELNGYEQVIIALHDKRLRPQSKLPYNNEIKALISEASAKEGTLFCVFANPYSIAGLPGIEQAGTISLHYQNDDYIQQAGAKLFLHEVLPSGKLPVGINAYFKFGDGINLKNKADLLR